MKQMQHEVVSYSNDDVAVLGLKPSKKSEDNTGCEWYFTYHHHTLPDY